MTLHRRTLLSALIALVPIAQVSQAAQMQADRILHPETVIFTPESRARLVALRAEPKFQPHDFPPLGYTGVDLPEDAAPLSAIVNGFLDSVLTLSDGPVEADTIRPLAYAAIEDADEFATEDRDRTWGYLIEAWYILGFRGALFAEQPGAWFQAPAGYTEPLPPGWAAPDRPRGVR